MQFLDRLRRGMSAGLAAFNGSLTGSNVITARNAHYDLLWLWWLGQWQNDPVVRSMSRREPVLYKNTMQLWRQASAVVNVYTQFVYPGPLSKDGKPLPDGSRGAIPLDPDTRNQTTDDAILAAFSMLMNQWQWSQYKSLRPKMAAIVGDCLTELVEDLDRGNVMPNTVDPRHVKHLELDSVGNIKAYTIEFEHQQEQSDAYGRQVKSESYTFRKEVDASAYRYFKNDKPYDYSGEGAVIPNLFGFVPAVWDRHEIVAGDDRGISALEKTLQQTMRLNRVLSHAADYLQTRFSSPVGIKGASIGRPGTTVRMGNNALNGTLDTAAEVEEAARLQAQTLNLIQMNDQGGFVTVDTDLGQTLELLKFQVESITAENPEARVGQELLQMTQLTAPGVERALFTILGLVEAVQANMDPQTVKLLQMGTTMMGYRLQQGHYPADLVKARPDRYEPFSTFNLDSYGQGLLECSIGPRPLFTEAPDEKATRLILLGQIIETGDPWLMAQAGIPEEEIARMQSEQQQRRAEMQAAFSVAGAGAQEEADEEAEPGATQPQPDGEAA